MGTVIVVVTFGLLLAPVIWLWWRYNHFVKHDRTTAGVWRSSDGVEYNVESDI